MHYTYKTSGTCSTRIDFDIVEGKLRNIVFTNGCNGNLQAIGRLLEGADPAFAIERLEGISCSGGPTSCGDQLARAIKQAVNG
ncbi:MAG: TIGR03905 family TSCPD domain-containing protein [Clostridia bacterium]|nr:TIGR03905 family TSCPD domain-containing protein [Clostridia bacterium]